MVITTGPDLLDELGARVEQAGKDGLAEPDAVIAWLELAQIAADSGHLLWAVPGMTVMGRKP
jgi:hypothetical protein